MGPSRIVCMVKDHQWVTGRVAEQWARELIKGKKSYHNRACSRCGKEQWNADDVEAEAERMLMMKERLGVTRKQAELEAMDPRKRPIDPNEFP